MIELTKDQKLHIDSNLAIIKAQNPELSEMILQNLEVAKKGEMTEERAAAFVNKAKEMSGVKIPNLEGIKEMVNKLKNA